MVALKRSEMRIFDDAFDMHGGYVLDFSDRTLAEFFEDEFGVEIYQEKYLSFPKIPSGLDSHRKAESSHH
jgi:hypothetical protein